MRRKVLFGFVAIVSLAAGACADKAAAIDASRSLTSCSSHTEVAKATASGEAACATARRHAYAYAAGRAGCSVSSVVRRRVSVQNFPIGGGRYRPAYVCRLTVRVCCRPVVRAPQRTIPRTLRRLPRNLMRR